MPAPKLHVAIALLCALVSPGLGKAQDSDMLSFHSAAGDQVDLIVGIERGVGSARDGVRLCLENPALNHSAKALSNRPDTPPEFVVPIGQSDCLTLAPLRQSLVFWSRSPHGVFAISMLAPLDLRGKVGHVYYLRWSQDGAQTPTDVPTK